MMQRTAKTIQRYIRYNTGGNEQSVQQQREILCVILRTVVIAVSTVRNGYWLPLSHSLASHRQSTVDDRYVWSSTPSAAIVEENEGFL